MPGSLSSALQTTNFGEPWAFRTNSHFIPAGKPAPPMPRRPESLTSATAFSSPAAPAASTLRSAVKGATPAAHGSQRKADFPRDPEEERLGGLARRASSRAASFPPQGTSFTAKAGARSQRPRQETSCTFTPASAAAAARARAASASPPAIQQAESRQTATSQREGGSRRKCGKKVATPWRRYIGVEVRLL